MQRRELFKLVGAGAALAACPAILSIDTFPHHLIKESNNHMLGIPGFDVSAGVRYYLSGVYLEKFDNLFKSTHLTHEYNRLVAKGVYQRRFAPVYHPNCIYAYTNQEISKQLADWFVESCQYREPVAFLNKGMSIEHSILNQEDRNKGPLLGLMYIAFDDFV